jgi:hypothetical protein
MRHPVNPAIRQGRFRALIKHIGAVEATPKGVPATGGVSGCVCNRESRTMPPVRLAAARTDALEAFAAPAWN